MVRHSDNPLRSSERHKGECKSDDGYEERSHHYIYIQHGSAPETLTCLNMRQI